MRNKVIKELIKGTLLAIADQMDTTIAEVIQENGENEKQGNAVTVLCSKRFLLRFIYNRPFSVILFSWDTSFLECIEYM